MADIGFSSFWEADLELTNENRRLEAGGSSSCASKRAQTITGHARWWW
jgi:hypothetical protein